MADAAKIRTVLVVDGVRIGVSTHCAIRWQQRCRPALNVPEALAQLRLIVEACGTFGERPEWLSEDENTAATRWLMIGDDVALPIERGVGTGQPVAVTCHARGALSDAARERRRATRAEGARTRRMIRSGGRANTEKSSMNARGAGSRKNFGRRRAS